MQFFYERYKRVIKLRLTKKFLKKIKLNPSIKTKFAQDYFTAFLNNYSIFMKFYRIPSATVNSLLGIAKAPTFVRIENFSQLLLDYFQNKKLFENFFTTDEIFKKKSYPTLLPVKVSLFKLFNFVLRNRQFLQKLFQVKKTHQFSRIHLKSFKKTRNRLGVYNYIFKMEQRLIPQFFFSFLFPKIRFLKQLFINGNLEINNQLVAGYNRFINNMDIIALPKLLQLSGINFIEHIFLRKLRLKLIRVKSFRHVFLSVFLKKSFKSKLFYYMPSITNKFFFKTLNISSFYFLFFLDLSFKVAGKTALKLPYTYYYHKLKISQISRSWNGISICFKRFIKINNFYSSIRKNFNNIDNFIFKPSLFYFLPNLTFINYLLFFWFKYLTQHQFVNMFFKKLYIFFNFKYLPLKLYNFRKSFLKKFGGSSINIIYNISYCLSLILFILFSHYFVYFNSFFFFKKSLKDATFVFFRKLLSIKTDLIFRQKKLKTSYIPKSYLRLQTFQFFSHSKSDSSLRYYENLLRDIMYLPVKKYNLSYVLVLRVLKFYKYFCPKKFINDNILLKKLDFLFLKLDYIYMKFKMIFKSWYLKKNNLLSTLYLKKLFLKFQFHLINNFFRKIQKFSQDKIFLNRINLYYSLSCYLQKESLDFTGNFTNDFYLLPETVLYEIKYHLKDLIFNVEQKKKIFCKNFFSIFVNLTNYFFTKNNLVNISFGYEYFLLKLFLMKLNKSINFFIFSYSIVKFLIINHVVSFFFSNSLFEKTNIFTYFIFDYYKYQDLKYNCKLFTKGLFSIKSKKMTNMGFSSKCLWFHKFCLSKKYNVSSKVQLKHPYPYISLKFQKFLLSKKIGQYTTPLYDRLAFRYKYQDVLGKQENLVRQTSDFSVIFPHNKFWKRNRRKI
jgi:hypothetical protein